MQEAKRLSKEGRKRPMKVGLRFFSVDSGVFQTDEFRAIRMKHGTIAELFVFKLWARVYGVEGYYCHWSDAIAETFVKYEMDNTIEAEKATEILKTCIEVGIFDEGLYDGKGILTSRDIQDRWLVAQKGNHRKEGIKCEYNLLDKV